MRRDDHGLRTLIPRPGPVPPSTIIIANTGSLKSTFTLNLPAAASGGLCADLTLKVTDLNSTAPDTGTVINTTALNRPA